MMNPIDVRPIPPEALGAAAAVVARGMGDNPHHLRDFGAAPGRRAGLCDVLYRVVLPLIRGGGMVLGAYDGETIVGALGATGPGQCRPSLGTQVRLAAGFVTSLGPGPALGTVRWMRARMAYDPGKAHWHLGPVAVEPARQGQGIGTALMRDFCRRVATWAPDAPVFLETESPRNVRFYERFGFHVASERPVLGVATWTMLAHLK